MSSDDEPETVAPGDYGEHYREDFLTQYRDYVASADRISDRRQLANSFFLTINTVLLGFGVDSLAGSMGFLPIAVAGCLLCYAWYALITSYRALNTAKFTVIQHLERQLPAATYTLEWRYLEDRTGRQRHTPFSGVEARVPWIFALLYLGVILTAPFMASPPATVEAAPACVAPSCPAVTDPGAG